MHTEVRHSRIWRLVSAGTLITALGALGLATVHGQESDDEVSFQRRHRRVAARSSTDALRALDDETPPSAPTEEAPPPSDTPPADQKPAYEDAAEKEKPAEEPAPEPWTLTNLFNNCEGGNTLKDCGVKISGHMQWGYQNNPDGAFTGNGPFVNQQEWGQFNLNQQYLFIEKIADGSKGWGWGFRVDGMYGVDGNEGQAFGNINPGHWDFLNGFDHGAYEFALPQVYGELAYDKWSIKMGHFYTIVGYEVVPSTGQFFLSRQLTFWNSEPFTHTGFLNSYKFNDKFTLMAGFVWGMDSGFYQFQSAGAILGGFSWIIDEKTTLAYGMIGGNLGWRGDGSINSVILSRQWTKCLSTVHQFDVLGSDLFIGNGGTGTPADFRNPASFTPRDSTGLINYAFYEVNKCVKAGIRFEWYKADSVSYYTLTGGVNFKPLPYLLIRPEVRGMWSPGNQDVYTGVHGYSGKLFNQTVFGIDTILTF